MFLSIEFFEGVLYLRWRLHLVYPWAANQVVYWLSVSAGRWGWTRVGIPQQAFFQGWLLLVLLTSGALSDPVLIDTIYTRMIWERRSWKRLLCSSYRSVYTDLFLYARNRLNDYGNTGRLVNVGRNLTQDSKIHVPNMNLAGFELFLPFTRGKQKVRCGTVFEVHTFATRFESWRFHRAFLLG